MEKLEKIAQHGYPPKIAKSSIYFNFRDDTVDIIDIENEDVDQK